MRITTLLEPLHKSKLLNDKMNSLKKEKALEIINSLRIPIRSISEFNAKKIILSNESDFDRKTLLDYKEALDFFSNIKENEFMLFRQEILSNKSTNKNVGFGILNILDNETKILLTSLIKETKIPETFPIIKNQSEFFESKKRIINYLNFKINEESKERIKTLKLINGVSLEKKSYIANSPNLEDSFLKFFILDEFLKKWGWSKKQSNIVKDAGKINFKRLLENLNTSNSKIIDNFFLDLEDNILNLNKILLKGVNPKQ